MAVNRVSGVIESEFNYEEGSGVVRYNPRETDPEVFIAELADKTGFVGSVVSPGEMSGSDGSGGGEAQQESHSDER